MSAEPIFLVAVIRPDMAQADVVAERLRSMRDATRAEPGNEFMELVVGDEDPRSTAARLLSRAATSS